MSINFLNNGIGPSAGGCTGQSPQNCNPNLSSHCSMPNTYLTHREMMSFSAIGRNERNQLMKAYLSYPPVMAGSTKPLKLPVVPANGIGVL